MNTTFDGGASQDPRSIWLHRFAFFTAAMTFVLIFVGGLVKSHEAGMSVPDWPTSFGHNMFALPFRMWMDNNAFYEHGHRLYASLVGFLILVQAFWIQRSETRTWVKRLGWAALVLVIVQGIFGGLTVMYYLPTAISSTHAGLAQTLFCLTLAISMVTSRSWKDAPTKIAETSAWGLRRLTAITVGVIFLQILIGAVMRHEEAGLAIMDFPLAQGKLIPDFATFGIAVHYTHRIGAVITTIFVIWTAFVALRQYRGRTEFTRPAMFAIAMVLLQFTLGALTVLHVKAPTMTTLHVSGGAATLGILMLMAIRARHLLLPNTASEDATAQVAVQNA
ncbi:MAG TPA: COX15/CtaA family protein [Candidatus Kapabacteria bacterium]|nr:COX15/CtaA family protein [Candidatus Kapabacteria bacterium]